jgi:NAD(P)-dependent dehydrogenase (short-subunit alcohol dehydrogenase family)
MNDYDFWFERGHVALINGASKGCRFAVAQCLAEQGIALAITARHADELEAAAEGSAVGIGFGRPVRAQANDARPKARQYYWRLFDHRNITSLRGDPKWT